MTRRQNAIRQLVSTSLALFALGFVVLHCTGCSSAAVSRAEVRGAVLATAEAVKIADETCAKYAIAKIDLDLARTCEDAYTQARGSLIVASSGIDAWTEQKRSAVTCAVIRAVEELSKMAKALSGKGAKVPPIIDDSIRLVSLLGGCNV
jgi:hypothetical protein